MEESERLRCLSSLQSTALNAIPHVGEAAALLVALLWSVGSLLFAWTTRRIGAHATNVLRITIAAVLLAAAATFTSGSPIPPGVRPQALAALALSGVIGLVAADYAYFRALLLMGPRRATLVAALAPVFTAAIGWAFLGEKLGRRGLLGIAVNGSIAVAKDWFHILKSVQKRSFFRPLRSMGATPPGSPAANRDNNDKWLCMVYFVRMDERRRLSTWGEIATFFECDVRTAQRWVKTRGLPVRKLPGGQRNSVFAYEDESARFD